MLRLTNTDVNDYNFTFPNSSTLQLSSSVGTDLAFKLLNAGAGDFNLDVGGDATFAGAVTVGGNILPSAGNSYDVGAAGTMFNNGYFLNVTAFTSLSAGSATFSGDVDINQSGTPVLSVTRNLGAGISPGTSIGFINFKNDASTSSDDRAVIFEGFTDGGSANATGGGLRIYTKIASNGNNAVALTIDNTQNTTFTGDVDFDENITLNFLSAVNLNITPLIVNKFINYLNQVELVNNFAKKKQILPIHQMSKEPSYLLVISIDYASS